MAAENTLREEQKIFLSLTSNIVCAYVSNNACREADLPALIKSVYHALGQAGKSEELQATESAIIEKPKPAINPEDSVADDYIICLEDGWRYKSLKRHLMSYYNMTPEQYRKKWGLDPDYPMVAPNYAKERARLAKKMGLGRKNSVRVPKK